MESNIKENQGSDGQDFQDEPTTTDFEKSKLERDVRQGQIDLDNPLQSEETPVLKESIDSDSNHSNGTIRDYSPDFDKNRNEEEDEEKDDFEVESDLDDDEINDRDDTLKSRNDNL
jgi:hypothetical protein